MRGVVVSVLISIIAYLYISSRRRAIILAQEMSQECKVKSTEAIELNRRQDAILNHMSAGLVIFDTNGIIEKVNTAFTLQLGHAASELVGKRGDDVFAALDENGKRISKAERLFTKVITTKKSSTDDSNYKNKNGDIITIRVHASPIIVGSKLIGVVMMCYDQQKERELENVKDEFVSLTSHQLRTPLTIIRLSAEMILRNKTDVLDKRNLEYLHRIELSTIRMAKLVNDILGISRIKLGKLTPSVEYTHLNKLLEDEIAEIQPLASQKGLSIQLSIEDDVYVYVDNIILSQIFNNLLANAVAYTSNIDTPIHVIVARNKRSLKISVKDRGIGIADKDKAKIANSFFRADNAKLI
jgi:PAS domain S-box-containing protein